MRRFLFVKIVQTCESNSRYFTQRINLAGLKGFSAYQKISAAMRVIAYGVPADYADEYLRIGEDTTIESVRRFAKMIIRVFVVLRWYCNLCCGIDICGPVAAAQEQITQNRPVKRYIP